MHFVSRSYSEKSLHVLEAHNTNEFLQWLLQHKIYDTVLDILPLGNIFNSTYADLALFIKQLVEMKYYSVQPIFFYINGNFMHYHSMSGYSREL